MEKPAPEMAGTPAHKKRRIGGTPAKTSFLGGGVVGGFVSTVANFAMGGPKTQSPTSVSSKTTIDSPAKAMDSPAKDVGVTNEENKLTIPTDEDIARFKKYSGKKSYAERITELKGAKARALELNNPVAAIEYQKNINTINIIASDAPLTAQKPPKSAKKAPRKSAAKAPKLAVKATPKKAVKATPKKAKATPTPARRSTRITNTPAKNRDN